MRQPRDSKNSSLMQVGSLMRQCQLKNRHRTAGCDRRLASGYVVHESGRRIAIGYPVQGNTLVERKRY